MNNPDATSRPSLCIKRTVQPFLLNPSYPHNPLLSLLILPLLALLLLPRGAAADQYHYVNTLIGDRASGMGAAYTAVSDDTTGLYYNPAGIVYATGKNVSASVNAYYNYVKSYKGVIGGDDWNRKSSALLPNYFGVVLPVGRFKLGFSYAVPDTISEDQDQVFFDVNENVGRYVIDFNNDDSTYNYGPSLAMELNDRLAVGATLYFHERRNQFILNQLVSRYDGTTEWTNQYFETREYGLRPILGVMWAPADKISIGLTFAKTMLFDSKTTGQIICSSDTTAGCPLAGNPSFYPTLSDPIPAMTDHKKKYPNEVAAGIAWFASDALLLSGDIKYYGSTKDDNFGNRESVVNLAVGAEYFPSSGIALRAGLFTDMANTPDVVNDGETTGQLEHVDLMGLSASISSFTRNTSVTLGGSYFQGDGKAQVVGGLPIVSDVEAVGWSIFLSSSYSY